MQNTEQGVLVVTFTESLPDADALEEALAAVSSAADVRVVLSCQTVSYFTASSLGRLLKLWRKVKDVGGRLVLCGLSPTFKEILRIDRLDDVFEVRTDVPAAVESLTTDPHWLAWNGGTVAKLAQAIHDEQAFDRLPILADALEESGCNDAAMLAHCREPVQHTRYCWLIDILSRRS
jgi:anti-anti-sigma factor